MKIDQPVGVPDPKETRKTARARSAALRGLAVLSFVVAVAAGLLAPVAEYFGNAETWSFAYVPALGAGMIAALVGLAIYVIRTPRRGGD